MQWRRRRLPSADTGTSGSKSVAVRALFASPRLSPAVTAQRPARPRGRAGLQRPAAGADRPRRDVAVPAGQVVLPGPPRRVRRQEQELVAAPPRLQRPRGHVAG